MLKGWYISIPDDKGRKALNNCFAYTEEEAETKLNKAMAVSKYPYAVHKWSAWIYELPGRRYWEPRNA